MRTLFVVAAACVMLGSAQLVSGPQILGGERVASATVTCYSNSACKTGAIDCNTYQSVSGGQPTYPNCTTENAPCSYCSPNTNLRTCMGQTGKHCYRNSGQSQSCGDYWIGACDAALQCVGSYTPITCVDANWDCSDANGGDCP